MSLVSKMDMHNIKNINNLLQSLAIENTMMFFKKPSQNSVWVFKELPPNHEVSLENYVYKVQYLNHVLFFMEKNDILYMSQSENRLKNIVSMDNNEGESFFSSSEKEFGFIGKGLLKTILSFAPEVFVQQESFEEIPDVQWESHAYEKGLQVFFDIY